MKIISEICNDQMKKEAGIGSGFELYRVSAYINEVLMYRMYIKSEDELSSIKDAADIFQQAQGL